MNLSRCNGSGEPRNSRRRWNHPIWWNSSGHPCGSSRMTSPEREHSRGDWVEHEELAKACRPLQRDDSKARANPCQRYPKERRKNTEQNLLTSEVRPNSLPRKAENVQCF